MKLESLERDSTTDKSLNRLADVAVIARCRIAKVEMLDHGCIFQGNGDLCDSPVECNEAKNVLFEQHI